jgi:hypothetical protein
MNTFSNAALTRSGGGGPNKCNLAVGSGAPPFFDFIPQLARQPPDPKWLLGAGRKRPTLLSLRRTLRSDPHTSGIP